MLVAFVAVNAFFMWSFPAWFSLFGEPDGLVTPAIDTWVISPLASVIAIVQAPTFAIYDGFGLDQVKLSNPGIALLWSTISTVLYAPLMLVAMRVWRMRRERRAAQQGVEADEARAG
jgi:hypothetical protein